MSSENNLGGTTPFPSYVFNLEYVRQTMHVILFTMANGQLMFFFTKPFPLNDLKEAACVIKSREK